MRTSGHGVYDFFIFDAHDPPSFMQEVASITGPAATPPRWTMGYMQSHRTLEDDAQLVAIVDSFRAKAIPLDAVIYLGTRFTPRGWNTEQPSFTYNLEVFERDPRAVIADLHERHVKVVVHLVPYDRDMLPTLHGTLPPPRARPSTPATSRRTGSATRGSCSTASAPSGLTRVTGLTSSSV